MLRFDHKFFFFKFKKTHQENSLCKETQGAIMDNFIEGYL